MGKYAIDPCGPLGTHTVFNTETGEALAHCKNWLHAESVIKVLTMKARPEPKPEAAPKLPKPKGKATAKPKKKAKSKARKTTTT